MYLKNKINMFGKSEFNYIILGVSGAVIYLLLLTIFVELFDVNLVLAVIMSYLPVFILSYLLTHSWVFKSEVRHSYSFIRYIFVTGLGFIINIVGMYLAVEVFDLWYLSSQLFIFLFVATNNYLLNKYWTFEKV